MKLTLGGMVHGMGATRSSSGRYSWGCSAPSERAWARAGFASALAPQVSAGQRTPLVLLPAVVTLFLLSRMAAGLSIYALAQGVVGLTQAVLVHRRARQVIPA